MNCDLRLSGLALLVLAASVQASDVRVVAPSGTAFTDVQVAVDASANGDIVIVRSGSYVGFQLVGRNVSVVSDTGSTVQIQGNIRVRNCTGTVVLAGLLVTGGTGADVAERNALTAGSNTGALRVEHCTLNGLPGGTPCETRSAALVQDCMNVAISGCILNGANSGGSVGGLGMTGSSGLTVRRSSVAVHDSMLTGGTSPCAFLGYAGADGGEGLQADDSFVFAANAQLRGGGGSPVTCGDGGAGGHGVESRGTTTIVRLLDSPMLGGPAGLGNTPYQCPCAPWWFCCDCFYDGSPGVPSFVHPGATVTTLGGAHRSFDGPHIARESTTITLTCRGEGGDAVSLAIGSGAPFLWSPAANGVVLASASGTPPRFMLLGVVPPSGVLLVPVAIPALPTGVLGDVRHLQPMHVSSAGTRHLAGSLSLVVVDSSI